MGKREERKEEEEWRAKEKELIRKGRVSERDEGFPNRDCADGKRPSVMVLP